jgi:hypothetical protein
MDRQGRKSRIKWAPLHDAHESAGGHESEIGQREVSTQKGDQTNLAVQRVLLRLTKRPRSRPASRDLTVVHLCASFTGSRVRRQDGDCCPSPKFCPRVILTGYGFAICRQRRIALAHDGHDCTPDGCRCIGFQDLQERVFQSLCAAVVATGPTSSPSAPFTSD